MLVQVLGATRGMHILEDTSTLLVVVVAVARRCWLVGRSRAGASGRLCRFGVPLVLVSQVTLLDRRTERGGSGRVRAGGVGAGGMPRVQAE